MVASVSAPIFFVALGPHCARPIGGELLLCALDAAHLRSVFLGRVWVLTHLDANKELTILARVPGRSSWGHVEVFVLCVLLSWQVPDERPERSG